jgi:hypothetical protein
MPGLTKEDALRLAAQAAGKPAPAGAKEESKPQKTEVMKAFVPAELPSEAEAGRPQKTEVMKAYTPVDEGKPAPAGADVRDMKTEAMPGLTKEEAMRLAAEAAGKGSGRPPSKPEIKAQKTEVMKAAPAEGTVSQVAKTEMLAGLSKEEALRLAAEAAGKPVPPGKGGPPGKKSGETKVKTEIIPAAAPVQKTEQLKAFVPSSEEAAEMRTAKTEAMPGLTKEEALKLASGEPAGAKSGRQPTPKGGGTAPMMSAFPTEAVAKGDQQSMKTEAMPGLSRAEAEKLAKAAGEADLQESRTDRMAGLDKDAAKREVDKIQFQDSKTQALPGLTREQAEREAGEARDTGSGKHPVDTEAEPKKPPTLAVIAVLLLIGVVAAFFAFKSPPGDQAGQVDPKKLEAAEKSIESALEDALNLEGE